MPPSTGRESSETEKLGLLAVKPETGAMGSAGGGVARPASACEKFVMACLWNDLCRCKLGHRVALARDASDSAKSDFDLEMPL